MKTFEVGKKYYESGLTYEITGRTAKTVKYVAIQHAGKFNERRNEERRAKVLEWTNGEAFIDGSRTIEA
ncbi:MAG: hypothetical protein ACOYBA_02350 [Coprococcus sp.]|jgi:hypothetical protein